MPTNQITYNSRVTDEALEKKFRDTFKSQGGAELVDDLYAQGVIVPIVDFTAAAQGSELRSDLQSAFDFATGSESVSNTTKTLISTPGFWTVFASISRTSDATNCLARLEIDDGLSAKTVYEIKFAAESASGVGGFAINYANVVFLRSGDSLKGITDVGSVKLGVSYRQIADVYGNLVNPLGFTSS